MKGLTQMKLLNMLVEKLLDKSPIMKRASELMVELSTEVYYLGTALHSLALTVKSHDTVIRELCARNGLIVKTVNFEEQEQSSNATVHKNKTDTKLN